MFPVAEHKSKMGKLEKMCKKIFTAKTRRRKEDLPQSGRGTKNVGRMANI
jgi:hypothetical protein